MAWNFVQYLCVVVLQTNVGNIIAIFSALFAPNQDVALGFATGTRAITHALCHTGLSCLIILCLAMVHHHDWVLVGPYAHALGERLMSSVDMVQS